MLAPWSRRCGTVEVMDGSVRRSWLLGIVPVCVLGIATTLGVARAEVAWTRQSGVWEVSLYRGARGDAWCSWLTGRQDATGQSRRNLSLQMRGDEVVLFLFIGDDPLPRSEMDGQILLGLDGRQAVIKIDLAQPLRNGFLMMRGIVARGAGAQSLFTAQFVNASSISLTTPGSTVWSLDLTGLAGTMSHMQQCLSEVDNRDGVR